MDFSNFGCSKKNKKYNNTPQYAIEMLMNGNKRYAAGESSYTISTKESRLASSKVHNPFATVVTCSDARVPVETIFDHALGDIFVIRTAGNTVDSDSVMGSIEFATEGLGVKVLIVLGHTGCVAVSVAMSSKEINICAPSFNRLILNIRKDFMMYADKITNVSDAIELNVKIQINKIMSDNCIKEMVKNGNLIVVGGVYNLETGIVSLIKE